MNETLSSEDNPESVTHVLRQFCYLSLRLLTVLIPPRLSQPRRLDVNDGSIDPGVYDELLDLGSEALVERKSLVGDMINAGDQWVDALDIVKNAAVLALRPMNQPVAFIN